MPAVHPLVAQRHPPCGRVRPPVDRQTWLLFGTMRVRVPPSPRTGSLWARTDLSLALMPRNAAAGPAGHARFVSLETASFPRCQHHLTPCYSRLGPRGLADTQCRGVVHVGHSWACGLPCISPRITMLSAFPSIYWLQHLLFDV